MGTIQKYIIKEGQFTFGQRIEMGKIVSNPKTTEWYKFKQMMTCLHPDYVVKYTVEEMEYFEQILEGIKHWVKREKSELKYVPTPEEMAAGIEVLTLRVGEMSTISAMAEKFSRDPDDILEWKYGKVFNLLFTNLQSFLYRDRLDKQLKKKYESKNRSKGRR